MGRGSSKAGGSGGINTNPKVEKQLNSIIKKTANLKNEQYRVIDENGDVVFYKKGKNDRVEMTVGDKRQYLDGSVTIHNHPDGGTFSSADLTDFGYGAKEIVVATPEGTYRLQNTKWGTKEQSNGWYNMREEITKIDNSFSTANLIKESNKIMEKSKVGKEMRSTSEKWVKRRKEGASQSELDKIMNKYNDLEVKYKKELSDVRRKLETKPYHDYYKKNAKKYGFKYIAPNGI